MNNDLTILPVVPEDQEINATQRELHPNIPDVYKGQLILLVGGVRMGKGTLWNNFLHNPNFYGGTEKEKNFFSSVSVISPTIWNDSTSRFTAKKWKDTCYDRFNRHGRNGGAVLRLCSRFRHYVTKPHACLYLYSTQKYNDAVPIIRANATGLMVSGMIKNKKELESLKYDLDDTFGGQFDSIMERARVTPYSWIYFRLDSTPPEAFLNFTEKVF